MKNYRNRNTHKRILNKKLKLSKNKMEEEMKKIT